MRTGHMLGVNTRDLRERTTVLELVLEGVVYKHQSVHGQGDGHVQDDGDPQRELVEVAL